MQIRVYEVPGFIKKGQRKLPFKIHVRATSKELAIEKVLQNLGSRHRADRRHIIINRKKVVIIKNPEKIRDSLVQAITTADNISIPWKE